MNEQFSKTILYGDAITSRVLQQRVNKLTRKLLRKSKTRQILHKQNGTLEIWKFRDDAKKKQSNSLIKENDVNMKILSGTCLPNSVFRKKIEEESPSVLTENKSTMDLYFEKMRNIEKLMAKADKIIEQHEEAKRQEIIRLNFGAKKIFNKYSKY